MTTFAVDKVKKAEALYPEAENLQASISNKIGVNPESCFQLPDSLNFVGASCIKNSFVGAVHAAYADHYPLVLSPDMIWQCVAQGFAIHVSKNAEKLRHMFVAHEGKKTLEVREDEFVKGSRYNNWTSTFEKFSERIRKNVGDDIHSLLTPEFSTTGPVERAAAQVVLMDTFKDYFDYRVLTRCGIPEITLKGTVDDWKKLRDKTLSLARFDLQWWTDAIKPILDEFVNASSVKINKKFWRSMYKHTGESGGPYINGWILTFFPYVGRTVDKLRPNKSISTWNTSHCVGITTDSFPRGFVTTPFVWQYFEEEFDMYFHAGFLGVAQDKTSFSLQPVIGWAVVSKEEEEKAKIHRKGSSLWY